LKFLIKAIIITKKVIQHHDYPPFHSLLAALEQARGQRDAQALEDALTEIYRHGLRVEAVPVLNQLLLEDWHTRHEDIARALQELRDERSIEALYAAASLVLPYLAYDEFFGLARKCTWALAKIATPVALARLRDLAQHPNPIIRGYAQKRLPEQPSSST
jgi:hypothetical protein